uniref:Mitotic spindle positioning n=1 Tax=Nothoprocta perdicaria TaxID=30464 RepID=A0A8C6YM13_NOTPE
AAPRGAGPGRRRQRPRLPCRRHQPRHRAERRAPAPPCSPRAMEPGPTRGLPCHPRRVRSDPPSPLSPVATSSQVAPRRRLSSQGHRAPLHPGTHGARAPSPSLIPGWPCTTEGFDTSAPSRAGGNGPEQGPSSSETPIEREIRLAMEREETLWKERGIPRPSSSSELVEIHTKPLLSVSLSALPGRKGKDKGRPSFYVQREIEQETKREEDLKRQGRLLGSYERGPRQELEQRRRVFQPDEAPPRGSSAPEPAPRPKPQGRWPRAGRGAAAPVLGHELLSAAARPLATLALDTSRGNAGFRCLLKCFSLAPVWPCSRVQRQSKFHQIHVCKFI